MSQSRITQGSDRLTQPTIKEGSVANSDTFGECHNLGFTQGSDGLTHATLQDGPGKIVNTTPGERTHVTRHEGSIVASPCLMSNKFRVTHSGEVIVMELLMTI